MHCPRHITLIYQFFMMILRQGKRVSTVSIMKINQIYQLLKTRRRTSFDDDRQRKDALLKTHVLYSHKDILQPCTHNRWVCSSNIGGKYGQVLIDSLAAFNL